MNLLLINPCLRPHRRNRNFPIGLGYVATALHRAGFTFDLLDLEVQRRDDTEIERELRRRDYDVVALGKLVTGYSIAKRLAAMVRRMHPKALLVAGNSLASSIAPILLRHTAFDVAVLGEGDVTMVELVGALRDGRPLNSVAGLAIRQPDGSIVETGLRPAITDIDTIPRIDYSLFDTATYVDYGIHDVPEPYPMPRDRIRAFVVNTARGCPFQCTFCYHVFHRDRYRVRAAAAVFDEIRYLHDTYGVNYINFFDELTFFSREQTADFIDRLLASGLTLYWTAVVRGNLFTEADLPLLHRMRAAGCQGLGFSLESANPEILASMKKRMSVDEFRAQKLALDQADIRSFTSLVIGYPQETLETLAQTFGVCRELRLYPSAGYLLPQPGTPMYDLARQMGRIPDEEAYLLQLGDRQDLRINLSRIPDDELQAAVEGHLAAIADDLGLQLDKGRLLKTGKMVLSESALGKPAATNVKE